MTRSQHRPRRRSQHRSQHQPQHEQHVDGYTPVLRRLEIDMEQIERQVFTGDATVTERIYRLSQEVIDLRQATSGLADVLQALRRGFDRYGIPDALQTYLRGVTDHLSRVDTRVGELRESLSQILTVNGTLVAQRQNEDMKKISGWAAILFAPTLIGGIYGMNFDDMPELHWAFGYPLAVGAMIAFALALFLIFKRQEWRQDRRRQPPPRGCSARRTVRVRNRGGRHERSREQRPARHRCAEHAGHPRRRRRGRHGLGRCARRARRVPRVPRRGLTAV